MTQDHKHAKDLKAKGRNSEDVHRPGDLHMISQEGQPGLGLVSSSRLLDQVLPDGVWTGGIETQQDQMSMDRFRTPQDTLTTQASDQCLHFLADRWTASLPPGFPAPPLQKGIRMPLKNRLGFHQVGCRLPSAPHS
jgi:hypothetical protein